MCGQHASPGWPSAGPEAQVSGPEEVLHAKWSPRVTFRMFGLCKPEVATSFHFVFDKYVGYLEPKD